LIRASPADQTCFSLEMACRRRLGFLDPLKRAAPLTPPYPDRACSDWAWGSLHREGHWRGGQGMAESGAPSRPAVLVCWLGVACGGRCLLGSGLSACCWGNPPPAVLNLVRSWCDATVGGAERGLGCDREAASRAACVRLWCSQPWCSPQNFYSAPGFRPGHRSRRILMSASTGVGHARSSEETPGRNRCGKAAACDGVDCPTCAIAQHGGGRSCPPLVAQ